MADEVDDQNDNYEEKVNVYFKLIYFDVLFISS